MIDERMKALRQKYSKSQGGYSKPPGVNPQVFGHRGKPPREGESVKVMGAPGQPQGAGTVIRVLSKFNVEVDVGGRTVEVDVIYSY